MMKATLSVLGKRISWKYDNMWNSKWSIFDNDGINIKYTGSSKSGKIESAQMMPYFFYSDLGISIAIKIVSDVLKMDFAGFNEQIK